LVRWCLHARLHAGPCEGHHEEEALKVF
jgi:hypothetical protein